MDAVINDEMVEAWFLRHPSLAYKLSEAALSDVEQWFPVIGVPANDGSIGLPIGLNPID